MKIIKLINLFCILTIIPNSSNSQVLDYTNRVNVKLEDGTDVNLIGEWNANGPTNKYYYLPTNLRLSFKSEDPTTPEFLFMKFTSDDSNGEDMKGALLHFLMEWGLTEFQKAEAEIHLKAKVQTLKQTNSIFGKVLNPKIIGSVDVQPDGEASFRIISATLNNKANVITSGLAPVMPGSKIAVAAKLDKTDSQLLDNTFSKARSITDLSIQLFFKYSMMRPAIQGEAIIDWTQISKQVEKFKASGRLKPDETCKDCDDDSKDEYVSDKIMHEFYNELTKTKAISIKTVDLLSTEKTQELMEQFYSMVTNMIATPVHTNDPAPDDEMKMSNTEDLQSVYKNAENWNIKMDKIRTKVQKGYEKITLNHTASLPANMYILGNMASWYNGVKSNKKCVNSVNLNDPFYQTRLINFIVDQESVKLFDEEVNYVTLQVRKRRSNGNPFEKSISISKLILKDKGLYATTNYARGEDKDPSVFEYKSLWSLKGGMLYPTSPDWEVGDWESITLTAPVAPREIEVEVDLDKMKQMGFRRAAVQLRYKKYGEEVETNIPISIATLSPEFPIVKKFIYTDRNTRGYAYRIILTHETEGKLVFDWVPSINDDDVFISLSDELTNKNSKLFKDAIFRGKNAISATGRIDPLNRILDRFKDVIEIISKNDQPPKR